MESGTSWNVGKACTRMPATSKASLCSTSVNGSSVRYLRAPTVPAVAKSPPSKCVQKTESPFTWSEWSCVSSTARTRPMSTPSSAARCKSARREMPQSTRTEPSGPSTTAAFPLEPLARTCR